MEINQGFTITKILLVDDEPSICESLQAFLEDAGYQTSIAHNGQEALDHISISEPDLVILDLYMPAMDGHELLAHLAKDHPTLPKLVFSGMNDKSIIDQVFSEGAWDYISKPIRNLVNLLDKVTHIEEEARQRLAFCH